MSTEIAERMMSLFAGYSRASGTHGMPEREPSGKWSIKKTAKTLNTGPTAKLWEQHLAGKRPLGVVPIMDDSTCVWGSIDIDEYNIDLLEVVARVENAKLPLVPCRSKSGGMHLFMFTSAPVSAGRMQETLRSLAASLGFEGSEIFPKQTNIEQGDFGNWLIAPYFGGTFGDKLQYQHGLKKSGAEQTATEFLSYAEKMRVTAEQMTGLVKKNKSSEASARSKSHRVASDPSAPFGDGPPCLQLLSASGFPEGGRNNALFHIGVYLKKAYPEDWKKRLEDDNQKYMRPPLPFEEVLSVQKQLEKKEYLYKCKDQPMASYCDKVTCLSRSHGVGDGMVVPVITHMRIIDSEEPEWYVSLKGSNKALVLNDERDLTDFKRFRNQCVRQLHITFHLLSDLYWTAIYQAALANKQVDDAPKDLTPIGEFQSLLEKYLTNRQSGTSREDLFRDAPWENEGEQHYEFTMVGLAGFLRHQGFKFTRQQPGRWIRELGGGPLNEHNGGVTKLKGKTLRIWQVPINVVEKTPEIAPPKMPEETI